MVTRLEFVATPAGPDPHSEPAGRIGLLRWAATLNEVAKLLGGAGLVLLDSSKQPALHLTFSSQVARAMASRGLPADAIRSIVESSAVNADVLSAFLGLNRTTIKRRADRDEPLPPEASAKALEFAELATLGAEVFGSIEAATRWLTRPHPLLEGETPLDRAKTRWGFDEVRSLLIAVRYGSAA